VREEPCGPDIAESWHSVSNQKEIQSHDQFQAQFSGPTESFEQKFEVAAADHTFVGDITYIHTNEGWLYLAVLLDLFNLEVVG
jgi:hypothetical protein